MNPWIPILVASAGAYVLKLAGFMVPSHLMEKPRFNVVAAMLPIGLLAGLVCVQVVGNAQALTVDGRVPGALTAIVLLYYKRSFIVVVIAAAVVTAIGRHFGLWA
jgi:branched-subunit amino acid transport protein